MVAFTALHQALGQPPGPITDQMLTNAVDQGVEESDQLDWKGERPAEADLARSDVVKDIAAFANSGGGVIVFGVKEASRKATERVDVGDVTEGYERTLRRAAVSGIQPPVFNLDVQRVGDEGQRALVVVVPGSVEVPHLIYRGEYFGAPIRNHADTEWMRERQLETLYRQRLDDRRNSDRALDDLYTEVADGRTVESRAWLVAVAYPRVPLVGRALDNGQMRTLVGRTETTALTWVPNGAGVHPLAAVDRDNPRRGLRRWVLSNTYEGRLDWRAATMAVHDSGAVSLIACAGGHRDSTGEGHLAGGRIRSSFVECAVSDWLAMLWEAAQATSISTDYDTVVGIVYDGSAGTTRDPILIETVDGFGFAFDGTSVPLARFTPVRTSIRVDVDKDTFLEQVYSVARDVLNQGGVQNVKLIPEPAER